MLVREASGHYRGVTTGYLTMWCPGCEDPHTISVSSSDGAQTWQWDGNADAPTISPSILVNQGHAHPGKQVCHSFVRAGRWEFLTDSTHPLAGQTVPMVPLPEWLANRED